jgi:hypothetical protein
MGEVAEPDTLGKTLVDSVAIYRLRKQAGTKKNKEDPCSIKPPEAGNCSLLAKVDALSRIETTEEDAGLAFGYGLEGRCWNIAFHLLLTVLVEDLQPADEDENNDRGKVRDHGNEDE